jgi:hypothetical protein
MSGASYVRVNSDFHTTRHLQLDESSCTCNIWLESLLQLRLTELLTIPILCFPANLLWRDKDIVDDMNHAVLRNTIRNSNTGEAIDLDVNVAAISEDIDA